MNNDTDYLQVMCLSLAALRPGWWVSDHKPPANDLEGLLPLCVVTPVPATTDIKGWNHRGALVEYHAFDIELLGSNETGAPNLFTLSREVKRLVYSLVNRYGITSVSNPITMVPRPDWSDRVQRYGGEFELGTYSNK